MEKLPPELLFKIMMYLPLVDRLSCSLTCRRLAEAMTRAQLLDDVWLNISENEIETARSVLLHTQRQYTKLSLYKVDLSKFDSEFWRKIGANLHVLEVVECSWSNQGFFAIVPKCTKLESLKIGYGHLNKISVDDLALPQNVCHEELRDSLSHLSHLHLEIILEAEILDLLLGLMPNVTSIYLSRWPDPKSDFMERLPSILKKHGIICTGADIMEVDSEELIEFIEITSGSLEDLRIYGFGLAESAYDAIAQCSSLRRLAACEVYESFHGSHFKELVSNSPDLETLELRDVRTLEDEDMVPLFELKKLHTLSLTGPFESGSRITTEFLCRLGELSTLVTLDLKRLNVDRRVMRSLGRLQNLRSLALDECMDAECFEAICDNFGRLTKLDLGIVWKLTDADGVKLCRFKELQSLRFCAGRGFTDKTFERGVGSRAMKSLTIIGCPITDAGLMSIASHHDRLETLELYDCKNITDAGVLALLQNEPRLRVLALTRSASLQGEWRTDLRNLRPRLCVWGV